jgi:hypothetical protein
VRRLVAWLRAQRDEYLFIQRYMDYGFYGMGPMKKITITRTETGLIIDGRWVDLAILATVIVDLASRDDRHPRAGDVEEFGVKLMAAIVGRDPEDPLGSKES